MKFWGRALSASALVLGSAATQAATLTLVISNIQSDVGKMTISAYDSKDGWLKEDKAVSRTAIVVADHLQGDSLTTTMELEPGDYAISIHHDDNDNGKMDTNFIGIPKEPTGLSNGAVPKFGPPKFKDAAVTVGEEPVAIELKLVKID